MLERDQDKRYTLDHILKSKWVTNNDKEKFDPEEFKKIYDREDIDKTGKGRFGNIDRYIKLKHGASFRHVEEKPLDK